MLPPVGVAIANVPHRWLQPDAAPFGRVMFGKSTQRQTAEFYAKRSEQEWRANDPMEALRWLEKAIQRAPEDTAHVLRMAHWLEQLENEGWATQALKWLHHGVCTRQDDWERHYAFGSALLEHRGFVPDIRLEDAGWYLQRAYDLWMLDHTDHPLSRMRLARLSAALGDYHAQAGETDRAHALFESAVNEHHGYGPYTQRLGDSWLRKAQQRGVANTDSPEADKALELLGQAVEELQTERASGRDKKGTSTRGLAACFHSFGEAYLWQGDDKAAAAAFRQAIGLCRQNGVYHGSLADALRNLGDVDAARTSYFTAARLDPKSGRYEYELSILAYREGNRALAITTAHNAAQKSPENALYTSHATTLKAGAPSPSTAKPA